MRIFAKPVRKFAHTDELHVVRRQTMKTLRRGVDVLSLVQYENRHRVDTIRARELTKMQVP
jgi:hypothetical protein